MVTVRTLYQRKAMIAMTEKGKVMGMTKTTTYCDHCGKELDTMKDYVDVELDLYEIIEADLCADCIEQLKKMAKDFCSYGERREGE